MNEVIKFLTMHDNLNSWLAAKERMLNVLKPISADTRMNESLLNQLEVLRAKLRDQEFQQLDDIDIERTWSNLVRRLE